jgi:hypothetical protein
MDTLAKKITRIIIYTILTFASLFVLFGIPFILDTWIFTIIIGVILITILSMSSIIFLIHWAWDK